MKLGKKNKSEESASVVDEKAKAKAAKKKKATDGAKYKALTPPLFFALGGALAAVILVGYLIQMMVIDSAERQANQSISEIALSSVQLQIDQRVSFITRELESIASLEPVASALDDSAKRKLMEKNIEGYLPYVSKVYFFKKGLASRDASSENPLGFSSLDLIKKAEKGQSPHPEAFLRGKEWFVQAAVPVKNAQLGQIAGVLLVVFEKGVVRESLQLVSGVDAGKISLVQVIGSSEQVIVTKGSGSENVLTRPTSVPHWQVRLQPASSATSFIDMTLYWVLVAGSGLLVMLVVAVPLMSLFKGLRQESIVVTQYAQGLLNAEKKKMPEVKYVMFHSMVSTMRRFALAAEKKAAAVVPEVKKAPVQPVKEEDHADPLFQDSDDLNIDMMDGDDDLLGLGQTADGVDPLDAENDMLTEVEGSAVDVPQSIFRAYDIRGIVGETLTPEIVLQIGLAIGSEAAKRGQATICVGYDGRLSSPELAEALISGLVKSGRDVVSVGCVPTPVLYFATHQLNTGSGVMITGSHNPADYNGFKIMLAGDTLANEDIQKLYDRILIQDYERGAGQVNHQDISRDYLDTILNDIAVAAPLKVVVDAGNGVAGELGPALIEELGCEVIPLHCEIDGSFPNHHPDPGKPENLQDLIRKVEEEGADLGVAFDGDGDRIGVVTNTGKIIWPDRLLMLFAKDVVSRNPGADVIFDVKCSRRLNGLISGYGGRPIMWKTGHSLIKAKMKETGALLAGEMSGHIFFKERWYGFDDGLYSAARLLEVLGIDERSSNDVFQSFPEDLSTPEINVAVTDEGKFNFVETLSSQGNFEGGNVSTIDGVRVDYPDGWGLCRASNTTPNLVLRFEADSDESLSRIQQVFREQLLMIDPELGLTF
ncbi:phosphomannomutase/phosphoglucomutase [Alkalimarinus coralli]|uniref:phosphomannomutase/phosphoglucomutase n=1 Tax=Alkalimarinus coralli TaxID=2935863 RepID=UPI0023DEEB5B|nr:phosphomannomutase/phosphoglucomutase [Alkalimarinus coralli]